MVTFYTTPRTAEVKYNCISMQAPTQLSWPNKEKVKNEIWFRAQVQGWCEVKADTTDCAEWKATQGGVTLVHASTLFTCTKPSDFILVFCALSAPFSVIFSLLANILHCSHLPLSYLLNLRGRAHLSDLVWAPARSLISQFASGYLFMNTHATSHLSWIHTSLHFDNLGL